MFNSKEGGVYFGGKYNEINRESRKKSGKTND